MPHLSSFPKQPSITTRESGQRGFTLVELMIIFTMIGIITALAVPSIKSMTRYHDSLNVAMHISAKLNGARDQASRRNRAYIIRMSDLSDVAPQGVVTLSEAVAPSCQSALENPDLISILETIGYGGSDPAGGVRLNEPTTGLRGWRTTLNGPFQSNVLELCYSAKGALFVKTGAMFSEVIGQLELAIQQFDGPPWQYFGPPRRVELTFSSGARVVK